MNDIINENMWIVKLLICILLFLICSNENAISCSIKVGVKVGVANILKLYGSQTAGII